MIFVRLLYGSGLRLMECLRLCVKDAVLGVQHSAWTLLSVRSSSAMAREKRIG